MGVGVGVGVGGVETSRRIVSAEEQSDHLPTVKPIWRRFCAWEVFNAAVCNGLCNLESISFIIRNAPLRPRDSCVKSISRLTLANGGRFYERGGSGSSGRRKGKQGRGFRVTLLLFEIKTRSFQLLNTSRLVSERLVAILLYRSNLASFSSRLSSSLGTGSLSYPVSSHFQPVPLFFLFVFSPSAPNSPVLGLHLDNQQEHRDRSTNYRFDIWSLIIGVLCRLVAPSRLFSWARSQNQFGIDTWRGKSWCAFYGDLFFLQLDTVSFGEFMSEFVRCLLEWKKRGDEVESFKSLLITSENDILLLDVNMRDLDGKKL